MEILDEFYRLLTPSGSLVFSVPVIQYEKDLARYFGKRVARQLNWESFHRNLFEPYYWQELLSKKGFAVEKIVHFQPAYFTFWHRMCRLSGKRGFAMFIPSINKIVWEKFRTHWVELVRDSVLHTQNGGNIFVVARKL